MLTEDFQNEYFEFVKNYIIQYAPNITVERSSGPPSGRKNEWCFGYEQPVTMEEKHRRWTITASLIVHHCQHFYPGLPLIVKLNPLLDYTPEMAALRTSRPELEKMYGDIHHRFVFYIV